MLKFIFCLALVSMIFGEEYPGFVKFVREEREYFISKEKQSCGQARAVCNFNGWTLAREQTPEDTKLLNELIVNSKRTEKDYWIGGYLYDNDGSPLWMWLDVGDVVQYKNWQTEQAPLDSGRCMLKTEGDLSGKWQAAECSSMHHYICRAV